MHLSWRQNLGMADRVLRIVAGLVLVYLAALHPIAIGSFLTALFWIFGIFLFIEGGLGY